MPRPIAQPAECFRGSQRMQQLGSLASVLFVGFGARRARQAVEKRLERITCCDAACDFRLRVGRAPRPRLVIVLFDDIGEHKSIAVTRHGTDESGFARNFAERPAERANCLAQCAVRYDDIAPDAIEDLPPMYRLVPTLDKKDKQIEIARDERQLMSVTDEQASAGRKDERVEPVAGHSRGGNSTKVTPYNDDVDQHRRLVTRYCVSTAFCLLTFFFCATVARSAESRPKRIGFSILEDYDKGENLGDVARDFGLFRELGVTTWRGSFGWDDYEPSRGQYDFGWLHLFANLADRHAITLRPCIGYTPAWAASGGSDKDAWNDPPRDLSDWERFVGRLATEMRRHRNIASYEIYNEENVAQWWDGSPSQYNEVLQRAARAVKAADRRAKVLLGGMVFPDETWIERVCAEGRSGRFIDVIPFHAYPETWTPPEVDLERYLGSQFEDGFVRAVDRDCGRKPIWINEMGFATVGGRSQHEQADWWVRAKQSVTRPITTLG